MDVNIASKAIKFRNELVALLNKYNAEISGSSFDDGSIDLEIMDAESQSRERFYMTDASDVHNSYDVRYEYLDNIFKGVTDDCYKRMVSEPVKEYLIKAMFPDKPFNSIVYTHSNLVYVLTTNRNKFNELMESHKYTKTRQSINEAWFELEDGTRYIMLRPSMNIRGIKIHNLIIDKNIDFSESGLREIILPMCVYLTRDNIKFF